MPAPPLSLTAPFHVFSTWEEDRGVPRARTSMAGGVTGPRVSSCGWFETDRWADWRNYLGGGGGERGWGDPREREERGGPHPPVAHAVASFACLPAHYPTIDIPLPTHCVPIPFTVPTRLYTCLTPPLPASTIHTRHSYYLPSCHVPLHLLASHCSLSYYLASCYCMWLWLYTHIPSCYNVVDFLTAWFETCSFQEWPLGGGSGRGGDRPILPCPLHHHHHLILCAWHAPLCSVLAPACTHTHC